MPVLRARGATCCNENGGLSARAAKEVGAAVVEIHRRAAAAFVSLYTVQDGSSFCIIRAAGETVGDRLGQGLAYSAAEARRSGLSLFLACPWKWNASAKAKGAPSVRSRRLCFSTVAKRRPIALQGAGLFRSPYLNPLLNGGRDRLNSMGLDQALFHFCYGATVSSAALVGAIAKVYTPEVGITAVVERVPWIFPSVDPSKVCPP